MSVDEVLQKLLLAYGPAGIASALLVWAAVRVYSDQRRDLADARAALAAALREKDELGHTMLATFSEQASDSLAQSKDLMGLVSAIKDQGARVEAELRENRNAR